MILEALQFTRLREPEWLFVLLLPIALLLWDRARSKHPSAQPLGPAFLLGDVPASIAWGPILAAGAQLVGLTLLALAMARPVERVALPPEREGVEILLLLDRSSSMNARDLDPARTRMQVAVDAATQFVAARSQDRIGLIAFARYPDLLSPTTLDHEALSMLLGEVEMVEADGPEDLTGIGSAVARAAKVLATRHAQSKIAVLLTDGQENVATPAEPGSLQPLEAAALCRAFGVRVYPIAMAASDPQGLRDLAQASGGQAFAAQNARALEQVFASLDQLAKSPLAETQFEEQDRFSAWLGLAVLAMLLGLVLRRGAGEVLP